MSGIPFVKSAAISRCLAIYSMFSEDEFNIFAISKRASEHPQKREEIKRKGTFSGIDYQYTTPTPFKPTSFLQRRVYKFKGRFNEYLLLLRKSFKKEIDILFFYPSGDVFDLLELMVYSFFSKVFGYKVVAHYVEFRSSFEDRKNLLLRMNDYLFDNFFMFFVDGAIPISEFLIDKIQSKRKKLPILKIPPIVNFNLFSKIEKTAGEDYFLYVGNSGHFKPIEIVLDAFEQVDNQSYYLYLILHRNSDQVLDKISKHSKKDLIKIFSDLEYSELIRYNINAKSLLIPLVDIIKDKARFPNKISEYLASSNPIITTNYGEIPYYFNDLDNALVAENDTSENFAKKLKFVIENPQEVEEIGKRGYETGLKFFNRNSHTEDLHDFVASVLKSRT